MARCGFVSYCLPPSWDFPHFLSTSQTWAKTTFSIGSVIKRMASATSSLVSWSYQWKVDSPKACEHFWQKHWLACSSLYGQSWCFCRTKGTDWLVKVSKGGKRPYGCELFLSFLFLPFLRPLSSELRSNLMTSKMLFSFTRSEVSGHVSKHLMELDNKEKWSPTLPFSYLMFTLWTFLKIFLFLLKNFDWSDQIFVV